MKIKVFAITLLLASVYAPISFGSEDGWTYAQRTAGKRSASSMDNKSKKCTKVKPYQGKLDFKSIQSAYSAEREADVREAQKQAGKFVLPAENPLVNVETKGKIQGWVEEFGNDIPGLNYYINHITNETKVVNPLEIKKGPTKINVATEFKASLEPKAWEALQTIASERKHASYLTDKDVVESDGGNWLQALAHVFVPIVNLSEEISSHDDKTTGIQAQVAANRDRLLDAIKQAEINETQGITADVAAHTTLGAMKALLAKLDAVIKKSGLERDADVIMAANTKLALRQRAGALGAFAGLRSSRGEKEVGLAFDMRRKAQQLHDEADVVVNPSYFAGFSTYIPGMPSISVPFWGSSAAVETVVQAVAPIVESTDVVAVK